MNDHAAAHREALESFRKRNGLNVYEWSKRAGINESTLRGYLYGRPDSTPPRAPSKTMEYLTLAKLAAVQGVTVAEMMGEVLPRDAAMGTVSIPFLAITAELDGRPIVNIDRERAPYRLPRHAFMDILEGDMERGRFFEMRSDSLAPEIRANDHVLLDLKRVSPGRDPGYYCVWNGTAPQLGLLTPLPGNRIRFLAETNTATSYDYSADNVQIIGRAVWRSGAI